MFERAKWMGSIPAKKPAPVMLMTWAGRTSMSVKVVILVKRE
jgi:hypothetical protein